MTENERLKIFRKHLKLTQDAIGKVIELKQGSYADVERGKVKVSGDIKNLLNKEFSLNIEWLESGLGDMIIEIDKSNINKYVGSQLNTLSNFMDQINKLINPGDQSGMEITPLYDRHITDHNVSRLGDDKIIPSALLINSAFTNCDLVIRHTDPAMTGYLPEKSYIGVKAIPKDSFMSMIVPGKLYVIVIKEYVIERLIYEGSVGKFLLKAHDSKAHDFEIKKEDITELWLIKSWMVAPEVEPV